MCSMQFSWHKWQSIECVHDIHDIYDAYNKKKLVNISIKRFGKTFSSFLHFPCLFDLRSFIFIFGSKIWGIHGMLLAIINWPFSAFHLISSLYYTIDNPHPLIIIWIYLICVFFTWFYISINLLGSKTCHFSTITAHENTWYIRKFSCGLFFSNRISN